MRKNHSFVVFLIGLLMLFLLTGCVDQSAPVEAKDTGENAADEEETLKIAATSVAIAEILERLGVEGVIAVPETEYELPESYSDAELIGTPMAPDMEILASLKPDWIFSPVSLEGDLAEQYENIGVSSAFFNLNSTAGMFQSILELGELIDKEEEAEELVDDFKTFMEQYAESNNGKESPRVLVLMGLPGSYVVATENSYAGSLVKLAGGTNVYEGESKEAFININPEDMVERVPDMILLTAHAMPEQVEEMFEEEFADNDIWQHFKAVQNEQVYTLSSGYFGMSANFTYKEALAELQELFYPESEKNEE